MPIVNGASPRCCRVRSTAGGHVAQPQGRPHGPQRMRLVGHGRAEHRHHAVADVLVHDATLLGDHGRREFEPLVEHADDLLRRQVLGQRREPAHVGKHRRHLPRLAAEAQVSLEQFRRDVRRHHEVEQAAVALLQQEPLGHLVERRGERAEFVAVWHFDAEVVVAATDTLGGAHERADRGRQLLRQHRTEQQREQQRGRGGDHLDPPDPLERRQHVVERNGDHGCDRARGGEGRRHQCHPAPVMRHIRRGAGPRCLDHLRGKRGVAGARTRRQACRRREADVRVHDRAQSGRHVVVDHETDRQAAHRLLEERQRMRQHEEQSPLHQPVAGGRALAAGHRLSKQVVPALRRRCGHRPAG